MPRGGLYEAINKIRVDALFEDMEARRSTFSGALSMLREQLPPLNVSREVAAAVMDRYDDQEMARAIVEGIFPRKL
jgi:hypothetical protein